LYIFVETLKHVKTSLTMSSITVEELVGGLKSLCLESTVRVLSFDYLKRSSTYLEAARSGHSTHRAHRLECISLHSEDSCLLSACRHMLFCHRRSWDTFTTKCKTFI